MTDEEAFELWWANIRPNLEHGRDMAVSMLATMPINGEFERRSKEKARRGWDEHDAGITRMDFKAVHDELQDELLDVAVYGAVLRTR